MNAFSIRDLKAQTYLFPYPSVTPGTAMRDAQEKMKQNPFLATHAEDFSLHHVGAWDDQAGHFVPQEPKHICELIALVDDHQAEPHAQLEVA